MKYNSIPVSKSDLRVSPTSCWFSLISTASLSSKTKGATVSSIELNSGDGCHPAKLVAIGSMVSFLQILAQRGLPPLESCWGTEIIGGCKRLVGIVNVGSSIGDGGSSCKWWNRAQMIAEVGGVEVRLGPDPLNRVLLEGEALEAEAEGPMYKVSISYEEMDKLAS